MSFYNREDRRLPIRPDLDQLKNQAKDLLRAIKHGDENVLKEFREFHPRDVAPENAKLADAQLALARAYGASNWTRIVEACNLIDAIWRDDIDAVRRIINTNPKLLNESSLITDRNWGPPMSYAANLGRNEIIKMLYAMGAKDTEHAVGRALLQSHTDTANILYELMGRPAVPDDALGGPAYTLSVEGTRALFEFGARVYGDNGECLAPVDVVLETDSRNPAAKHAILAMYEQHGFEFPDTPVMALHRGRIDLLEKHLTADSGLLSCTFSHEEIYPPELGCHDEVLATQGTPLAGTTLLHMCIDYDEWEIFNWLLDKGADVNARATIDKDGFGGHTPLFCTMVSMPNFWMNYQGRKQSAPFAKLLLERGADINIRASLRKKLHPGYGPKYDVENTYEYRNVTALEWGERFHAKVFVSEPAIDLIKAVN